MPTVLLLLCCSCCAVQYHRHTKSVSNVAHVLVVTILKVFTQVSKFSINLLSQSTVKLCFYYLFIYKILWTRSPGMVGIQVSKIVKKQHCKERHKNAAWLDLMAQQFSYLVLVCYCAEKKWKLVSILANIFYYNLIQDWQYQINNIANVS